MPRAMNIPDAKAAVDKEWKKLETIPAWQLDKSEEQKGGGQGDGVPKASLQQAAADLRGFRTCVFANTSWLGWHT